LATGANSIAITLAVVGVASLAIAILKVHRQIDRRIDQAGRL
jgi:hypothetical protein